LDTLSALKGKNPGLPFHSVFDKEFFPFGRVLDVPCAALMETCKAATVMPETGSRYVPSMPELEAMPEFLRLGHLLGGELTLEIGCCWGYNRLLNCLEYHRASEWNIAVTDMVLILARQQDMEGFNLPAGKTEAFYVPMGTAIEVYATTLHFCPCQTEDNGFISIVLLPKGTNLPLHAPKPEGGDGPLLWAKNKWLIAHAQNLPVINRGAYPGLHGENYQIKY